LASERRRLIEAVVERAVIRDGSIEVALTREAATIMGEATVVTAWHKPAGVSRELIPPLEASLSTHERRGQTPRSSFLPASPGPSLPRRAHRGTDSRHRRSCAAGEALRPLDRYAAIASFSRPEPGPGHRRQPPARGIGLTRLADLLATGPSSSRCSACKRRGRRAHGIGTPSFRRGVEINRRRIRAGKRSHSTLRSSPNRLSPSEPVSADVA
jgi:hypothetical protein